MERVLGIDVGYAIVGWSILEESSIANKPNLIAYGDIQTSKTDTIDVRLGEIFNELKEVIEEFKPESIAIEDLFYFKNQKTVIKVAQARGVIILAGNTYGLRYYSYTPLQVKTSVTGYGRADKTQIQKMIKLIYGLKEVPKPDDVADAIAVATCHLQSYKLQEKLQL